MARNPLPEDVDARPLPDRRRALSRHLPVMAAAGMLFSPAWALNVGAPHIQSALFQPLRLLLPLQLQPGESLSPDCVKVVIVAGESRIPADQVQVSLQGRTEGEISAVRVGSLAPIDEPIVTISLSLGCPTRFTRQFTAFIDPPQASARADALPPVPEGEQLYSPALRAALATAGSRPSELLAPVRSASAGSGPGISSVPGAVAPVASAASSAAPVLPNLSSSDGPAAAKPAVPAKPPKPARKPRPAPAGSTSPASPASPVLAEAERQGVPSSVPGPRPAARLQLEAPEVLTTPAASASAASAEAAASEAARRVTELEAELARVRTESREVKEALRQLSAQVRQPQGMDRSWLLMLAGLSLLLAVACAWLFMQLKSLRQATHDAWWAHLPESEGGRPRRPTPSSHAPLVVPPEGWPSPVEPDPAILARTPSPAAAPVPASASVDISTDAAQDFLNSERTPADGPDTLPVDPATEGVSLQLLDMPQTNTDLQPLQALPEPDAVSGVSVEELIDLEQQVDFFMVLGQQEAAIDLLSQRLHAAGRHTALPYLKLLEILQRHEDQAGFERVAGEFSERFHAQAPIWSDDIAAGEGLLAYGQAIELIVQSWRDAAMTMQLIQTLLTHGDPDGHAFNLAAYRDILMLYAVARDISEHEVRGSDIDLFLPLDGSAPGSATAMMATMPWQIPGGPAPAPGSVDLDLDLTRDSR